MYTTILEGNSFILSQLLMMETGVQIRFNVHVTEAKLSTVPLSDIITMHTFIFTKVSVLKAENPNLV